MAPPRPCPGAARRAALPTLALAVLALACLVPAAAAVFVNFDNCLDRNYREQSNPERLQFIPLHVSATFNTSDPARHLNITVYGNVTGQAVSGPYPPADSDIWDDDSNPFGKLVNVSQSNNKYTTLAGSIKVLTYTAYTMDPAPFCDSTVHEQCPIKPAFGANASDIATLPGFTVGHDFYSSYSFATLASTFQIISGDASNQTLACVSAAITPALGDTLSDMLTYLPAAILALVGLATIFAAIFSPWGTADIFRWSSNYGRDEDLLRLVTPGFGDCLQYIQFIVLAGSLNLQYPGFFQPVVSQASWSVLLFNQSLVSQDQGNSSLVDGIYVANGTYGISRLGEYVGLAHERDIWASMAVFLLVLIGIVTLLAQLFFAGRWAYRAFTDKQGGDLRNQNFPFTIGNIVRIVFNFFMLPIIAISLFQLVVSPRSPASVVATAVVLLLLVIGVAAWIFYLIFTTRPRVNLFDHLPTVLMYGPLYNTYSDDAAPFAFIPVLLTTIRGIAIGAIQPSGIAQIILLAICEVILILTLHAFRPFQSNTSMNAYHTFFSVVRLATILLMIAFVPTLGVMEEQKGWIGYIILFLHALVLVFGFFLNSLQTIIEVAARLTGAGADQRGGLTKVFGKRQLQRRNHRHQRSSLNSEAAMLAHDGDRKSIQMMGGRARSMSASSAVLLNQPYGSQRASLGFENFSQGGDLSNYGGTSPGTPGTHATPWSGLAGGSGPSSRRPTMGAALENADPYYRPPRPRKHTMESMAASSQRGGGSTDLGNVAYTDVPDRGESGDVGEGPSSWSPQRGSITPAYLRTHRDDSDPALAGADEGKPTDYSVRESDFYYGIRGPALSAQPTRKLKTGPADPMGPVSSAAGWFKSLNLFGAKKKEKAKGFEVVRSTRAPPQMMAVDEEDDDSPHVAQEPYRDSPESPEAKKGSQHNSPDMAVAGASMQRSHDSDSDRDSLDRDFEYGGNRVSDLAPTLGPIETGAGIELPSRIGSRAGSSKAPSRAPTIPRKSSRRTPSTEHAVLESTNRLSTIMSSPRSSAHMPTSSAPTHLHPNSNSNVPIRLPFGSTEPSPSPERSPDISASSSLYHGQPGASTDMHPLTSNDGLGLAPPPAIQNSNERPLSTGYVHQHRARDSIQNDEASLRTQRHLQSQAQAAEIVDGRTMSLSTAHSGRS